MESISVVFNSTFIVSLKKSRWIAPGADGLPYNEYGGMCARPHMHLNRLFVRTHHWNVWSTIRSFLMIDIRSASKFHSLLFHELICNGTYSPWRGRSGHHCTKPLKLYHFLKSKREFISWCFPQWMQHFCLRLVQYKDYLIHTGGTNGVLSPEHQYPQHWVRTHAFPVVYGLTHEILRDFTRYCRPFWITSSGQQEVVWNIDENISKLLSTLCLQMGQDR